MGIAVYWDNVEQTILCQSFVGGWTWEEYDRMVNQTYITIRSMNHTVHVIADIRFTAPQMNGPSWPSYSRAMRMIPTNMGLAITAGTGYFSTAFFHQLAQSFPHAAKRVRHVLTLEAAYDLIERFDGCFEQAC
jgi:hypothetical protein